MNTNEPTINRPKRHKYTSEEYKRVFDEAFEESPSVALIAAGLLLVLGAAMGGFRRED